MRSPRHTPSRHRPPTGRPNGRPMTGSSGRSSDYPKSCGVLDPPLSRGMTVGLEETQYVYAAERFALLLVRLLAADVLQLGEYGVDIEVVALLFGWLEFRLLAGGLGGRQQGGAAVGRVDRLLLGRALHLEVELDLRAQAERHRVHRRQRRGVPVGAVAHAGDSGLGGADQPHDLR